MTSTLTNASTYVETAHRIGSRICRDAIWAGDRVNWIGDSMEFVGNQWKVAHRALSPYLYDGTAGIALFLAALHRQSPERLYRRTAEAALRQACQRLQQDPPSVAFYSGNAGVAWVALRAAEYLEAPEWRDTAGRLLDQVRGYQPSEQEVDVISGPAGAIPALLAMDRRSEAVRLGEWLLDRSVKSEAGWSWDTLPGNGAHLTGFSHGASGVGWAMLELAQVTGDQRFRHAFDEACRYERSHYDAQQQNWHDLRSDDTLAYAAQANSAPVCGMAWCHGAPGIALARLRAFELTRDAAIAAEARTAVATTARALSEATGAQDNFSLCHGQCGNAEPLLLSARLLPDAAWMPVVETVAQRGIEMHERKGLLWNCGVNGGAETPNLMLGTAGIGYFYLRLAEPDRTPSVLLLGAN